VRREHPRKLCADARGRAGDKGYTIGQGRLSKLDPSPGWRGRGFADGIGPGAGASIAADHGSCNPKLSGSE